MRASRATDSAARVIRCWANQRSCASELFAPCFLGSVELLEQLRRCMAVTDGSSASGAENGAADFFKFLEWRFVHHDWEKKVQIGPEIIFLAIARLFPFA